MNVPNRTPNVFGQSSEFAFNIYNARIIALLEVRHEARSESCLGERTNELLKNLHIYHATLKKNIVRKPTGPRIGTILVLRIW